MRLNYPKQRWEQIPERIRSLDTTELDFSDHDERELHKMEMDRRIHITSNFLPEYSWDGSVREHRTDTDDVGITNNDDDRESETETQPGLEAFIENV